MREIAVHLLGPPRIELAGRAHPGRLGERAWGLLAYLLCAEAPPARADLLARLFGGTDDPRRGMRLSIEALEQTLPGATIEGDPMRIVLPPGTVVDVAVVSAGEWSDALALRGLERELLEGLDFAAAPAFQIWLEAQRARLGAQAEAVLREGALASLATGMHHEAAELAERLVALNPCDETYRALHARSHSGSATTAAGAAPRLVSGRAIAEAQLEAGQAAIAAGALDAGLDCLRRAVASARTSSAVDVQARALVSLGSALVHAPRWHEEEASPALHEAAALATRAELPGVAAAALRELGFSEFLRARYERAERWLVRADALADGDPAERGHIASVLGAVYSDTAHYERAQEKLADGLELSVQTGATRRAAYTLSMIGRVHLLQGELDEAARCLDESLALVRADGWASFTPWPEALRGDVDLLSGDVERAARAYERSFALGCELNDPCWQGIAARGVGLVAAARGDLDGALEWLADAQRRCSRLPDAYVWVGVYAHEAMCALAVEHELDSAADLVDDLVAVTMRGGMRDLAVRAQVHRARLGNPSALAAARMLAEGIASPALEAVLDGRAMSLASGKVGTPNAVPAPAPVLRRGPRASTSANPAGLTRRELEVLGLLADGARNAQIAERLVLSPKTVGHHVSAILRKLNAATRTEAVAEAGRKGMIAR